MLTLCNHLLFYHGSLNANNDILFQQCNQTCAPSPSDSLINCDHLWITNTPPKWSFSRTTRSLRRSQPLISSSKYRRDSSRLSHSSSYHILVITYLFTNLIISVCPPFRPRPDSGTYYELLLSIDFIHSAEVAHCTHTTEPMASSSHSGGPTAF